MRQDQQDRLDLLVQQDLKEFKAFKEFKARPVQLVRKAKPVQLDLQVQLERHQQFQVLQDQLDLLVQLDLQDHKEMHQQFLVRLEQAVPQEQQDHQVHKEFKDLPEQQDRKVLQVQMVVLQVYLILRQTQLQHQVILVLAIFAGTMQLRSMQLRF